VEENRSGERWCAIFTNPSIASAPQIVAVARKTRTPTTRMVVNGVIPVPNNKGMRPPLEAKSGRGLHVRIRRAFRAESDGGGSSSATG